MPIPPPPASRPPGAPQSGGLPSGSLDAAPSRTGAAPGHRPGFILITLVVILLVIALMAIAYLGVVRYRTQEIGNGRAGNIGLVVTSVENTILGTLASDYPVAQALSQPEPYDFAWTDASTTLMPYSTVRPAPGVARQGFTAGNPAGDDAWLASSIPEPGASGGLVWPHLTNLRGTFLDLHVSNTSDLARINQDASRAYVPVEIPSGNLESDISVSDPRLVDTDGDGIGDALWFYPPISMIGDRRYTASVYIEDLSAKLNVNTATPLRTAGAYAATDKGPLGLSSCDVDLSAAAVLWPDITEAQLNALLDLRWGDPAAATAAPNNVYPYNAPKPPYPMDYLARMRYWAQRACRANLDGTPLPNEDATFDTAGGAAFGRRFGAYTGNGADAFGDEIELRYHGGLNHKAPGTSDAPTRLEALLGLRCGATESLYSDVPGVASVDDYFRKNPRRWLTCFSGECLDQKGIDSTFASMSRLRPDINMTTDLYGQGPYTYLKTFTWPGEDRPAFSWFKGPDAAAGTADDYPFPEGFKQRVPAAVDRPQAYANLFASAVLSGRGGEAAGRNNRINACWASYGNAPLPLLTEAYFQTYRATFSGAAGATTVNGDGTYGVPSWAWGTSLGYCLEFSNPYATPVKLTGLQWSIHTPGYVFIGNAPLLSAAQETAWPDKDEQGDSVLLPGHKLLLYRDSGGTNSPATPTANLNAIGTRIQSVVGAVPAATTIASGGPTDVLGRPKLHAALSAWNINADLGFGDTTDAKNTSCLEVQLWAPAYWASMYANCDYAPSYLTVPLSRVTAERSPAAASWASPPNATPVGIVQVSAKTWGLSEGLDLLQCRPARQNKVWVDYYDTGYFDRNTATANTKGLSLRSGGIPADLGDAKVAYNRAFNTFDPALLSTLGLDDKNLSASAPAASPTRASVKGDTYWWPTNNWYWDSASGRARYRLPTRYTSLADLQRIVMLDFPGPAGSDATRGPALSNRNQSGAAYTDSDLAHSLYQRLHDQSGETAPGTYRMWSDVQALRDGGYPPLDILRLHPRVLAGFTPYDTATTPSRKVPWNWYEELCWSDGLPGFSNAVAPDTSVAPARMTTPLFVDGNADGKGPDASNDGLKQWNVAECDFAETTAHGRLNLNTAPVWLLEEALPVKDPTIRKAVANLIGKLRKNTGGSRLAFGLAGTRADGDRGIAYLSELVPAVADAVKNGTLVDASGTMANWPTVPGNDPVSGLPNAAKPASIAGTTYSYVGDKDLRLDTLLGILGPLWQTTSPRSDYFAAHILVQGYQANNFSSGVIESRRVLVIFRRASTGTTVVARYTY